LIFLDRNDRVRVVLEVPVKVTKDAHFL
jgi:hypothetical protein